MTPRYRLLAIDIDGTLITEKDGISPENTTAVSEAAAAGVHVSLSTGRSLSAVKPYVDALSLTKDFHILFDGALVAGKHDSGPVFIGDIPGTVLREIIDYIGKHDMDIELASIDGHFARRETWSTRAKKEFFGYDTIICPLTDACERTRILRRDFVISTPEENKEAEGFMEHFAGKAQFSEAFSPRYPGVRFVNIIAAGLTKGKALGELAAHLDIDMREVMAVGDWLNDIPMLRSAGLGVAMGNAHDDVKQAADVVTLRVEEDGLAAAIEDYLL